MTRLNLLVNLVIGVGVAVVTGNPGTFVGWMVGACLWFLVFAPRTARGKR